MKLKIFQRPLREIKITARSNYQLGYQLGKKNKKNISQILSLARPVQWPTAKLAEQTLFSYSPEYFEELQGLAAGAQVSFRELLVLNFFEDQFWTGKVEHCSLIFKRRFRDFVLGWNEDGQYQNLKRMVLVEATLGQLQFFTLNYPGLLCGDTLALTARGLMIAIQNLPGSTLTGQGLPKGMVGRRLLEAGSLPDLLESFQQLNQFGFSQSFHVFALEMATGKILSIETEAGASNPKFKFRLYPKPTLFVHANHPLITSLPKEKSTASSVLASRQRQAYLEEVGRSKKLDPERMALILSGKLPPHIYSEAVICRQNDQNITLHGQVVQIFADQRLTKIWSSPRPPAVDPFSKWKRKTFHF